MWILSTSSTITPIYPVCMHNVNVQENSIDSKRTWILSYGTEEIDAYELIEQMKVHNH